MSLKRGNYDVTEETHATFDAEEGGCRLGRSAVTFMGPWHFNRVHAAASDKPIVIGLTSDA